MQSNFYQHRVVVITGGSSGIGFALAKEFTKQNAHVTIISRDKNKLLSAQEALAALTSQVSAVDIIRADVALQDQIVNAINAVGIKFGKIDVLINGAGIATYGRFKDQPFESLEKCMQVNYMGSVYASKAAWAFLKKAQGQLSFISSVAGYLGLIGYSSYSPTKFAMTGLAESLRFEGADDDIRVSIIYPPDTDTPMLRNGNINNIPECIALSKNIKVKTAEEVARIYIRGLQKNEFEIYCDLDSRMIRWLKNNFPSVFVYATNRIIKKARKF